MSDDQMAILGCGAAVVICTMILMISAQIGKYTRREEAEAEPESIRLPQRQAGRRAA